MAKIQQALNESAVARWTVLVLVASMMFFAYMFVDILSPLASLLEKTPHLGWNQGVFGTYAAGEYLLNVFGFLILAGIILDKMGVRFTGTLSASLMVIGAAIKYIGISEWFGANDMVWLNSWWPSMPGSAKIAMFGFMIFGCGCEMAGTTVSKVLAKWFKGKEMALAMGLEMSIARIGVFAAMFFSPLISQRFGVDGMDSVTAPFLFSGLLLVIGLLNYLVFCVMDRRLDQFTVDSLQLTDEFHWSDIGTTLRSPGFWLITLFCVLFYSAVSPFLKFSTKLMVMKYGVDADLAGFFSSIAPFGTILMTPLFGLIYDRYGKGVTLVITGALMLTAVHFGFSLPMHSSTIAITLMVILSIGYSLAPAALWPCVPKIIPLKCLGTAYSMIFFIQNFGRAIIPMFVGKANETDPTYETSMLIFGFTALGAALTAMAMWYVDRRKGYGLQLPNIRK